MSQKSLKRPEDTSDQSPLSNPSNTPLWSCDEQGELLLNINKQFKSYKDTNPQNPQNSPIPNALSRIRHFDKDTENTVLKPFRSLVWDKPAGIDKLCLTTTDFELDSALKFAQTYHHLQPSQTHLSFYDHVIKDKVSDEWGRSYSKKLLDKKKESALERYYNYQKVLDFFKHEYNLPHLPESDHISFDAFCEQYPDPNESTLPTFAQPHLLTTKRGEDLYCKSLYANDPDGKFKIDIARFREAPSCLVTFNPSKYLGKDYCDLASSEDVKTVLSSLESTLYDQYSLKINLSNAKISRIDFAKDREMNYHTYMYEKVFSLLRLKRQTKHAIYPHGFLQGNKQREFVFYDKAVEVLKNKINSSPYMRAEYRLLQTKVVGAIGLGSPSDLYSYGNDGVNCLYNLLLSKDLITDKDELTKGVANSVLDFTDVLSLLDSISKSGAKRNTALLLAAHFGVESMFSMYDRNQWKNLLLQRYERNHVNNTLNQLESMLKSIKSANNFSIVAGYHEIKSKFAA